MYRKCLSVSLACLMAASAVAPAFAADVTGSSDVTLTVEAEEQPEVIQVRVPSVIPINMDADGAVTVADNLQIENLSESVDIEVTGLSVTGKDGWEIKSFDSDLSAQPENTKVLAMQFRGDGTQDGGSVVVTDGNWNITHKSNLDLNVAAKLPRQNGGYEEATNIAQVNYVIAAQD